MLVSVLLDELRLISKILVSGNLRNLNLNSHQPELERDLWHIVKEPEGR